MPWSDDQTTPSYAARPVLSLRAFLKPSAPPGSGSGIHTPLPRASGIVPRTARAVAPRSQPAYAQPSAARSVAPAQRPATHSSLQLRAAAELPARAYDPQPAPVSPPQHYPPPLPAAPKATATQQPARARPRPQSLLQSFALQQLISDPLVWLGNPQRALLLLAILSGSAVLALLCLGGFLDPVSAP